MIIPSEGEARGIVSPLNFRSLDCSGQVEMLDSISSLYEVGKTIGRGEFAKVKVAVCRKSGETVRVEFARTMAD